MMLQGFEKFPGEQVLPHCPAMSHLIGKQRMIKTDPKKKSLKHDFLMDMARNHGFHLKRQGYLVANYPRTK